MNAAVSNSWRPTKLKFTGRVVAGGTPESGNPHYWDGTVPWLTPVDLGNERNDTITASKRTLTEAGVRAAGLERLPIGSVVFSSRAPIGSVGLLACEAVTNQGCKALVPDSRELDSRFGFYLALNSTETLQSLGLGTTFTELSTYALKNLAVSLPSPAEQRRIAGYLDEATGKVDRLVALRRRQMELLREQRAALIQQAVTRGLNPNAPLKDSGLPWLGQIPKHWKVAVLKWQMQIASGDSVLTEALLPDPDGVSNIPAIGGNGVMGYTARSNVSSPMLAIGRVGALCGNVHYVPPPAWITDNALMAFGVRGYSLEFLWRLLTVLNLNRLANQNAQPLITGTLVKNQRAPLPPLEEQREILEFIEAESAKIDRILSAYTRQLELLMEYRAALIHESVTGQRAVSAPEARA